MLILIKFEYEKEKCNKNTHTNTNLHKKNMGLNYSLSFASSWRIWSVRRPFSTLHTSACYVLRKRCLNLFTIELHIQIVIFYSHFNISWMNVSDNEKAHECCTVFPGNLHWDISMFHTKQWLWVVNLFNCRHWSKTRKWKRKEHTHSYGDWIFTWATGIREL